MIISASYKTDIPAFYGPWFLRRLRAGYCKMVNPYGRQVYTVDLRPQAVDGFVFWTKNIAPFLTTLAEVHSLGYPFVIHHGINAYPRALESAVIDPQRSIENVRRIADTHGPRVVVWRYDTILYSSLTPRDFHLRTFEHLASRLEGATDEVVVSFACLYRKTLRNLNLAAQTSGFTWEDPPTEDKRSLAADLAQIAKSHSMQLSICSQRDYLVPQAADARCIDAQRLSDVAGLPIAAKLKGNRAECGCYQSRDIGEYDTCPHGCVYCYAVRDPELSRQRYKDHDPESEFLFAPPHKPNQAGGAPGLFT